MNETQQAYAAAVDANCYTNVVSYQLNLTFSALEFLVL